MGLYSYPYIIKTVFISQKLQYVPVPVPVHVPAIAKRLCRQATGCTFTRDRAAHGLQQEPGKLYSLLGNNDRTMNEIQYVYDAGGHKKSVIVPIEIWERTLQVQKPRLASCNPQDYYGIYRDRIKNPQEVARALRSEWNRG
jgi:hypothetical protein